MSIYTSNPQEIRAGAASFYTDVYGKQIVRPTREDIEKFLSADIDNDPINELRTRKIPNKLREQIEGNLTKALFHYMNPYSAPGIDGLLVAFIWNFWTSLEELEWLSFNNMEKKSKLI